MTSQKRNTKVAFILGAGFSKCAELPIQAEFSPLLTSENYDSSLDQSITRIIKGFLKNVFGWQEGREIPALEDVFTSIDLSANNGHFLGHQYDPPMLRAIRRMLIYRIFQILDRQFKICPEIEDLLRHYLTQDCSFLVMNWDIVLEKHLQEVNPELAINYIAPSFDWTSLKREPQHKGIKVCKIHGSSNWVYCESCKALFYQLDKKISLHQKVGLKEDDFRLFNENVQQEQILLKNSFEPEVDNHCCKFCHNLVSSHIATFSYRKSFRTAAYAAIWNEAENLLAAADTWVFIGYSLPEADFELKHLIKSAELRIPKKAGKRKIEAVLYQDKQAKTKFERFFGKENVTVFENGLSDYVKSL